jgi:hypothetical protein
MNVMNTEDVHLPQAGSWIDSAPAPKCVKKHEVWTLLGLALQFDTGACQRASFFRIVNGELLNEVLDTMKRSQNYAGAMDTHARGERAKRYSAVARYVLPTQDAECFIIHANEGWERWLTPKFTCGRIKQMRA